MVRYGELPERKIVGKTVHDAVESFFEDEECMGCHANDFKREIVLHALMAAIKLERDNVKEGSHQKLDDLLITLEHVIGNDMGVYTHPMTMDLHIGEKNLRECKRCGQKVPNGAICNDCGDKEEGK